MAGQDLLEAMQNPKFYPHQPARVEMLQTHISFIFVAGEYVYKIKKPVDFGFLDFTSLEKRYHYCRQELELNRRLAPDVYLEVVPISRDDGGTYLLERGKETIEYAVKMKKLPEEKMLKRLFAEGKVDASLLDAIARKLFFFHDQAATGGEIDQMGSRETILRNHEENFVQTIPFINITISQGKYDFIKSYARKFLEEQDKLLDRRIIEHKIRDCHGDLHLEHICLLDNEVVIFDCIEFNERFRYEDVAAEVAFLAMDLDYNNLSGHADDFVAAYVKHSRDCKVLSLLNFYKCYYAYVRGKVISFRLNDRNINEADRESAVKSAARYFDLSYVYASRLAKPALIIMAGLMGTGKSMLAKSLATHLGAEVIRSDVLRKDMLHIKPASRHYDDFGQGIYSADITRHTYKKALEKAEVLIRSGRSVIIDASYKKHRDRRDAFETAQKSAADFFVLECTCPEEQIKKRLERRKLKSSEVSDGRWEIFAAQKADFEEISEFPPDIHLAVDTSQEHDLSLDKALKHLQPAKGRKPAD